MRAERPLVLDTHVWVWAVEGHVDRLGRAALDAIERAAAEGRLHASAISVWEIGMLVKKGRLTLARSVAGWVAEARRPPGILVMPVTPDVALDGADLPAFEHGDPADRLIAATARALSARLVTCDARLLGYGSTGHLRTLDARP